MDPVPTTALAEHALKSGIDQELFERIMRRIYRYFLRMVRDESDAQECLQETLLLLVRSLREEAYDPSYSFNGWMWLKASTVYAQWCRKRQRSERPVPSPAPRPELADVDRKLDAEEVLDAILERLGPKTYEAFQLYYREELTQAEVARIMGCGEKAVRQRIREAHALADALLDRTGAARDPQRRHRRARPLDSGRADARGD